MPCQKTSRWLAPIWQDNELDIEIEGQAWRRRVETRIRFVSRRRNDKETRLVYFDDDGDVVHEDQWVNGPGQTFIRSTAVRLPERPNEGWFTVASEGPLYPYAQIEISRVAQALGPPSRIVESTRSIPFSDYPLPLIVGPEAPDWEVATR